MIVNNIKATALATAVLGSMLLGSVSPVFAQTVTPASGTRNIQSRCSLIAGRVTNALGNAQNHQALVNNLLTKYTHFLQSRATTFQQRYGMDAYNTLNGYFQTLGNTYATQLVNDWNTYVADLNNLQSMSNQGNCGTTNGLFATQLRQTISDRGKIISDREALRDYVRNTIRPYIRSLKPITTVTPVTSITP